MGQCSFFPTLQVRKREIHGSENGQHSLSFSSSKALQCTCCWLLFVCLYRLLCHCNGMQFELFAMSGLKNIFEHISIYMCRLTLAHLSKPPVDGGMKWLCNNCHELAMRSVLTYLERCFVGPVLGLTCGRLERTGPSIGNMIERSSNVGIVLMGRYCRGLAKAT